jgi:hypothetical protein
MQPALPCDMPIELPGQIVESPQLQQEIGIKGAYQNQLTLMQYPVLQQNRVVNLNPIGDTRDSDLFEKLLLFTESNFPDENLFEPNPLFMVGEQTTNPFVYVWEGCSNIYDDKVSQHVSYCNYYTIGEDCLDCTDNCKTKSQQIHLTARVAYYYYCYYPY